MVGPDNALPGGSTPVLEMPFFHRVLGDRLDRQFEGAEVIHLAMGCFWGAEKLFWQTPGVLLTSVGYMGGYTPNPTYREVCTGRTGHAETVRVVYDPDAISTDEIVRLFFENHDPTQGMRQGNDVGTQYRSAIWCTSADQLITATRVRGEYQADLLNAGYGQISTTIEMAESPFYPAEAEHQQYLQANPQGYCPVHATGVCLSH
ncbi:peptide-methionine (S)-S-oxide reductase MsrA [Acidipropionibacterium jensenii]|nr:peptide-methionine (S)-S-oxide reductase MsrA [Acidipropionibacterium jensenii]MDN5976963.1 peptide-methionine (S)-S-oxide reductase MsrA [Acidipropionibacterium jensenii]MDN5995838.1 peptide-methionine (S)-S-oxide reductase MsrA [Acidipropionibacterium jensenii]MDN6426124.1 peptide-methionine (S)-S-oxide reductase MsrA [Acidipropionibacterium jensenii]MDN6441331.1 peptide-methionine (S)-S-oxide reductase MsrA [Acidipropionibacterium jensenii]MDN6479812.1 peptide-methionine (S)-S-oxide redu